jgi:hypothetical protein
MVFWSWMSITQNSEKNRQQQVARQRVLAQWRGVDLAPLEKARLKAGKPIGNILPSVLSQLKLERKQSDAEVVKVWNHLLDPVITAHAQPANLHKGTLFINVDSSPWLDEIVRYRRKDILDRLQLSFGRDLISKLSFRLG